jgi:phosphate transport system protein
MTRAPYQEELNRLREAVLEELDLVEAQLALVLDALDRGETAITDQVVAREAEIDRLYGALQRDLVTVIARQSPVACDLRLITALLHISRMVERMGDQCVNIAKLLTVAGPVPARADELQSCLLSMGRATQEAVRSAGEALREEDPAAAAVLHDGDSVVNELNRSCFMQAIDVGDTAERRMWTTAMTLVARSLERIADNAVDIAAHLHFAVTGTFEARTA